jgi:hypothetical protein
MKKSYKYISSIAFLFLLNSAYSSPGDTTWVTVMNLRTLDHYGNYDTSASFPTGVTWRKIRMHYVLGRYACPGNPQYCGSWDYTTEMYAMPAGADTLEIARIITPYATDWLAKNKKHDYVVEVTDYSSVLTGSLGMRFRYEGYSWGFNVTVKFEMIEGTPPMNAIQVKKIYNGYFTYGSSTNPIENYLVPKTFSYSPATPKVFMKNTVSGHGSDGNGCSEFCKKYYNLKVNANLVSTTQLWRSDCGINQEYPQTGTWLFNRGNWCPGAVVWPIYHDLSGLTSPNTSFTVDADMQAYSIANASGGYNWHSQLILYGAPNYSLDASIEDIISPTLDENHVRQNPACSNPVIKVKNTGTGTITSMVFSYGLQGKASSSYTWSGNLGFLQDEDIVLPLQASKMLSTTNKVFTVSLVHVNGGADGNSFNNIYSSVSKPVIKLPNDMSIRLKTNGSISALDGFSETTWKLLDQGGNVVADRDSMLTNTQYMDTVHLDYGCYQLVIDDYGCDGFEWWFYANYSPNPGNGFMRIERADTAGIIMNLSGDFGCQQVISFRVDSLQQPDETGLGVSVRQTSSFRIFPNPASDNFVLSLNSETPSDFHVSVSGLAGQVYISRIYKDTREIREVIPSGSLSPGIYFVSMSVSGQPAITKKLVIQR